MSAELLPTTLATMGNIPMAAIIAPKTRPPATPPTTPPMIRCLREKLALGSVVVAMPTSLYLGFGRSECGRWDATDRYLLGRRSSLRPPESTGRRVLTLEGGARTVARAAALLEGKPVSARPGVSEEEGVAP